MSDARPVLAEPDRVLWEAIGDGDVDAADLSRDELVVAVEQLTEAFTEYRAETNRELAKLHNRITDIDRKADGNLVSERSTTLGKYASMGEESRRELLGTTDRLAVAIYEHWDEMVENFPNGERGVSTRRNSTRKYNPSRIKRELEERVPTDLLNRDGELPWVSIHRAMMAVASLSGGEPEHRHGRKHITGGLFEFHEHRSPDNTQAREYKVLVET